MNYPSSPEVLPLGFFELDETYTVLNYRPEKEEESTDSAHEIVGSNFFAYIAPIARFREFQERIKTFRHSPAPAESFQFTFRFSNRIFPVRVLLAHIREHSELGNRDVLFVHIRPAVEKIAA